MLEDNKEDGTVSELFFNVLTKLSSLVQQTVRHFSLWAYFILAVVKVD